METRDLSGRRRSGRDHKRARIEQAGQSSSQPERKPLHIVNNLKGRPQTPDPFLRAALEAVKGIPMFGGDQGAGSHAEAGSSTWPQGISELELRDPLRRVFREVEHGRTRYDMVREKLSAFADEHPNHLGIILPLVNTLERIPEAMNQGNMQEARGHVKAFKQQVEDIVQQDTGVYIGHFNYQEIGEDVQRSIPQELREDVQRSIPQELGEDVQRSIPQELGEDVQRSIPQELGELREQLESMPVAKEQLIWETVEHFHHPGENGQTRIEQAHREMSELNATWEVDPSQGMVWYLEQGRNCEATLRDLRQTRKDDRETEVTLYEKLKKQVKELDHPEVRGIWQRLNNMTSIEKELHNQGWEFDRSNPDYDFPQVIELKRWRIGELADEDVPTAHQWQRACYSLTAGSVVVPYFIDRINAKLRTEIDPEQKKVLQAVKEGLENGRMFPQDLPQKDGQPLYKEIIPYLPALADKCENSVLFVIRQLHNGALAEEGRIYITHEALALSNILMSKDGCDVDNRRISDLMSGKTRCTSFKVMKDEREYARGEAIREEENYQQQFRERWNGESIRMVINLLLSNEPAFVVAGVPEEKQVFVSNQSRVASEHITGKEKTFYNVSVGSAGKEKQEHYRIYDY